MNAAPQQVNRLCRILCQWRFISLTLIHSPCPALWPACPALPCSSSLSPEKATPARGPPSLARKSKGAGVRRPLGQCPLCRTRRNSNSAARWLGWAGWAGWPPGPQPRPLPLSAPDAHAQRRNTQDAGTSAASSHAQRHTRSTHTHTHTASPPPPSAAKGRRRLATTSSIEANTVHARPPSPSPTISLSCSRHTLPPLHASPSTIHPRFRFNYPPSFDTIRSHTETERDRGEHRKTTTRNKYHPPSRQHIARTQRSTAYTQANRLCCPTPSTHSTPSDWFANRRRTKNTSCPPAFPYISLTPPTPATRPPC